nr:MAG TPA: hypothetical protein [Bacteriophage sp.]
MLLEWLLSGTSAFSVNLFSTKKVEGSFFL